MSVPTFDAQALALGRVTVQSALGEPLRVDIDLPEISPDEVSSLRAVIASPTAFQSAGLEYNTALSNVQVTVQRRSDGRYFLRLTGDRPINDPFVDVVLETTWSSGRITRDFTMLFDPPALRQGQQPLTAQASPVSPGRTESRATPPQVRPPQRSAPGAAARAPATAAAPSTPPAPSSNAPAAKGDGKPVTVQAGDTAGKIAAANKPTTVSLDQMLVAMLRSNPDAFGGGNVNRLRAGTVLNLPSQEQVEAVTPSDAHETLVAQSRDFNEFRRKLAEGLPAAPTAGADRESRGKVQAQVDEKKPSTATPDKLTLSKGALQGKASDDKIARERSAQASSARVAELNRNMADLQGLTAAAGPKSGASAPVAAGAAKPAGSAAGPALPLGTPAATAARPASAPTTTAARAASAPAAVTATAPAKSASAPGAAVPATAAAPAPTSATTSAATSPSTTAGKAATAASAPATTSPPTAATAASTGASSPVAATSPATPSPATTPPAAKKPAAVPVPAAEP
ncbi:MAG: FimV family protein, partial [Ramlibacter sp.]